MPRSQSKDTGRKLFWQVTTPTRVFLIEAESQDDAIPALLKDMGMANRPWLARQDEPELAWRTALPTPEEVETYLKRHTRRKPPAIAKAVRRQRERRHFHEEKK